MNMSGAGSLISSPVSATAVTDVYTDLNGLQQLRGSTDKDEALKKVAQQFESMFINMMMKNMRSANAVFEEGSLFNSKESEFYRDMHDQQLSLTLAHQKGFGIAEALYRQMSSNYGIDKDSGVDKESGADKDSGGSAESIKQSLESVSKSGIQRASVSETPEEFIRMLLPKVKQAGSELGVDPEIIVAQAALETGWGSRVVADENGKSSNNLFNIKAGSQWRGESVPVKTLEYRDGTFKPEVDEFRRYESMDESIRDYVNLIKRGDHYQEALQADSGSEYLEKLQQAGYATDPAYADKILSVYQKITQTKRS